MFKSLISTRFIGESFFRVHPYCTSIRIPKTNKYIFAIFINILLIALMIPGVSTFKIEEQTKFHLYQTEESEYDSRGSDSYKKKSESFVFTDNDSVSFPEQSGYISENSLEINRHLLLKCHVSLKFVQRNEKYNENGRYIKDLIFTTEEMRKFLSNLDTRWIVDVKEIPLSRMNNNILSGDGVKEKIKNTVNGKNEPIISLKKIVNPSNLGDEYFFRDSDRSLMLNITLGFAIPMGYGDQEQKTLLVSLVEDTFKKQNIKPLDQQRRHLNNLWKLFKDEDERSLAIVPNNDIGSDHNSNRNKEILSRRLINIPRKDKAKNDAPKKLLDDSLIVTLYLEGDIKLDGIGLKATENSLEIACLVICFMLGLFMLLSRQRKKKSECNAIVVKEIDQLVSQCDRSTAASRMVRHSMESNARNSNDRMDDRSIERTCFYNSQGHSDNTNCSIKKTMRVVDNESVERKLVERSRSDDEVPRVDTSFINIQSTRSDKTLRCEIKETRTKCRERKRPRRKEKRSSMSTTVESELLFSESNQFHLRLGTEFSCSPSPSIVRAMKNYLSHKDVRSQKSGFPNAYYTESSTGSRALAKIPNEETNIMSFENKRFNFNRSEEEIINQHCSGYLNQKRAVKMKEDNSSYPQDYCTVNEHGSTRKEMRKKSLKSSINERSINAKSSLSKNIKSVRKKELKSIKSTDETCSKDVQLLESNRKAASGERKVPFQSYNRPSKQHTSICNDEKQVLPLVNQENMRETAISKINMKQRFRSDTIKSDSRPCRERTNNSGKCSEIIDNKSNTSKAIQLPSSLCRGTDERILHIETLNRPSEQKRSVYYDEQKEFPLPDRINTRNTKKSNIHIKNRDKTGTPDIESRSCAERASKKSPRPTIIDNKINLSKLRKSGDETNTVTSRFGGIDENDHSVLNHFCNDENTMLMCAAAKKVCQRFNNDDSTQELDYSGRYISDKTPLSNTEEKNKKKTKLMIKDTNREENLETSKNLKVSTAKQNREQKSHKHSTDAGNGGDYSSHFLSKEPNSMKTRKINHHNNELQLDIYQNVDSSLQHPNGISYSDVKGSNRETRSSSNELTTDLKTDCAKNSSTASFALKKADDDCSSSTFFHHPYDPIKKTDTESIVRKRKRRMLDKSGKILNDIDFSFLSAEKQKTSSNYEIALGSIISRSSVSKNEGGSFDTQDRNSLTKKKYKKCRSEKNVPVDVISFKRKKK